MFTPNERRILQHLRGHPDVDLATLAHGCGLAKSSTHVALQHLTEMKVVEVTNRRPKAQYRVASSDGLERAGQRLLSEFRSALNPTPLVQARPRLAFTDNYVLTDGQMQELKTRYEIATFPARTGFVHDRLFRERAAGADVAVRFDSGRIDDDMLRALPRLKALVLPACYPENVDRDVCAAHGVLVRSADPVLERYNRSAQNEYVLRAVLSLLTPAHGAVATLERAWTDQLGEDLAGKRIGFVSAQASIRQLTELFRMLNCEVAASNTSLQPPPSSDAGLDSYLSFEELWGWSDVVVVLDGARLDLNDALTRRSGPGLLILLAPSITFDVDLMIQRLNERRLRGLALDAFPTSWLDTQTTAQVARALAKLNELPNVMVTPETSVFTRSSLQTSRAQVFQTLMNLDISHVRRRTVPNPSAPKLRANGR